MSLEVSLKSLSITVYIISYNQMEFLERAIKSVLAQTRMPDQILIVDDASTDGSPALIQRYADAHPGLIDVIFHEINMGIGSTRRAAVLAAKGDLVTYLDGDDVYYPQKIMLEEQALVNNPQAGYVYSNFYFIDEQDHKVQLWNDSGRFLEGDVFEDYLCFQFSGGVSHRCELVRKNILLDTDHYEAGLNLYQTNDVMIRVSRMAACVAIDQPTHAYRKHLGGVHRKPYSVHYHALSYIYKKNKPLLDGLLDADTKRIQRRQNKILSQYAWRAVKQQANGDIEGTRSQAIKYAKFGVRHQPMSVLRPKHLFRFIIAIIRSNSAGQVPSLRAGQCS